MSMRPPNRVSMRFWSLLPKAAAAAGAYIVLSDSGVQRGPTTTTTYAHFCICIFLLSPFFYYHSSGVTSKVDRIFNFANAFAKLPCRWALGSLSLSFPLLTPNWHLKCACCCCCRCLSIGITRFDTPADISISQCNSGLVFQSGGRTQVVYHTRASIWHIF